MQNMKVDIVYYVIPADFEMEFNLNGCCPMRLLKTLTYNKKEYIEGLARAVSRSKIIIACGPIYGDDGLIKITSKATHRPTQIINNADYGIAQDLNVEIIEDSVPLVTSSGLFGGVIIESGPQTIIILSENKDIRKNVMQNLIHAYVRDVSILEIRRNSGSSVLSGAPAESSTEDETADILTPEDFENLPTDGEAIDFSKEDTLEPEPELEDTAAPSDEALKAVAQEINDLSSEIGKTLYANDNSNLLNENENEEPAKADGPVTFTENYEIELSDDAYVDDSYEDSNETEPGQESTAEETTAAPQIDFEIDRTDETESAEAQEEPSVSVADFLFEETKSNQNANPQEETSAKNDNPFEKESLLNYAYVLTDDEGENKEKHKLQVRTILIIIGALAVVLLVLSYFFVYLPLEGGIAPLDYIKSFLSVKAYHLLWRG